MNSSLLGEQIAKFRKALGMTQEDLGRAVGISAQAVSRWECGGAPDVALLPSLADALGVTIDALFGREGGEEVSIEDAVRRWIVTVPRDRRMNELCRLAWSAMGPVMLETGGDLKNTVEFHRESRCEWEDAADGGPRMILRRTSVFQENGIALGVNAEDMSFISIWPEPEAGYEAYMAENRWCRRLFRVLAMPRCLELLEYLHSKPVRDCRRYTPGAAAKALGMEKAEAERLMNALAETNLLKCSELETEEGLIHSFRLWENDALIPFLYLARWLVTGGICAVSCAGREKPVLHGDKWQEKEED